MLTGNDSLQEDSAPVDFETGTTDVAFEIGSNIETFASVNAYADWLVAQAVQRWQHVFGKPALPNFGPPDVGVITLAREMTSVAIPNEASLDAFEVHYSLQGNKPRILPTPSQKPMRS